MLKELQRMHDEEDDEEEGGVSRDIPDDYGGWRGMFGGGNRGV